MTSSSTVIDSAPDGWINDDPSIRREDLYAANIMMVMTDIDPIVLDDHVSSRSNTVSPSPSDKAPPTRGRVLYCRKCEGHGKQVILKGHAPACPYILCSCSSCDKLMNKRLKSFNKRNKEKIELATQLAAKRRFEVSDCDSGRGSSSTPSSGTCSPDTIMSMCNANQPSSSKSSVSSIRENRSMSLGSMTVMSYDIWKAKCAAEKRAKEEREKEIVENGEEKSPSPEPLPPRKRAHTFVTLEDKQLPRINLNMNKDKKKGRYITLPTIPPMSVLISEEDEKELTPDEVIPKETKEVVDTPIKAPIALRKGSVPVTMYSHLSRPSPIPVTQNQMMSNLFTPSHTLPTSLPTSTVPTSIPTSLPTEQILASLLPATTLPTSVLLQNSMLLQQQHQQQQQQQQQNFLSTLLNPEFSAALLSHHLPTSTANGVPNMFELLQRSQQLSQLTQALSGTSIENSNCSPLFNNHLLSSLVGRQPIFTSTI